MVSLDSINEEKNSCELENYDEINDANDKITSLLGQVDDTISINFALLVEEFKSIRDQFPVYEELYNYIDTNIVLTRTQLNNLKLDIGGAHGERENYETHIKHEKSKIDSLCARLEELIIVKTRINDGYNTVYNDLNDELTTMKSALGTEIDE